MWNNEGNIDNQSKVKLNHEYILAYCKDERTYPHPLVIAPDIEEDSKLYNEMIENSITKNGPGNPPSEVVLPVGFAATFEAGTISARMDEWPHLRDEVIVLDSRLSKAVRAYSGWSSRRLLDAFIANQCQPILDAKGLLTWFKLTHTGAIYIYKKRENQSHVLSVIRNVGTVKKTSGILERMGFAFSYPKPIDLVEYFLQFTNIDNARVLDYYAGSGTTAHAAVSLYRQSGIHRRYILVDNGTNLDSIVRPRIQKVVYAPEWSKCRPTTRNQAVRHLVKYTRLESYEDALNNLETRRTDKQQLLLDDSEAEGADGLREQYILRYMLDVETRGSQSLLNVQAFTDPTAYKLKVKRPGSDESREVNIDLLETFNWLIGLTVRHIAAPQTFSAAFERDSEKRLRLKGCLKQEEDGPCWFRTVIGTIPDGRRTLVIWRKLTGEPEQDNLVLDEWFTKQGYSSKDSEFDLIYVNGGNNLENLKTPRRPVEGAAHRRGLPSLDVRDGGGLMAKKKAKATHKKPQVLFTSKLVLNQWLLSLFNVKRFEELAEHLHDEALEGLDENNIHRFHHALTTHHSDLTQLPTELLLEYDQNIVKHTQRLNERRITRGEEPIVWKYFQYLTLLFSEIYLDRYFRDPKALLVDLNVQVAAYNADKPEADQIAALDEAAEAWQQLNKLAFWMATGSGKTLLMHANILQYQQALTRHGRRRELNRILLLTPNEGLSQQHLREFEAAGIDAELFNKDGRGLFSGQAVEILEVTRLRDEMGDKTIAIDAFEGNNLGARG